MPLLYLAPETVAEEPSESDGEEEEEEEEEEDEAVVDKPVSPKESDPKIGEDEELCASFQCVSLQKVRLHQYEDDMTCSQIDLKYRVFGLLFPFVSIIGWACQLQSLQLQPIRKKRC